MHPWLNVALNGTVIQAKIQGKVSLPQGRKSKSSEWEQRNERKNEKKEKTAITRCWYYDIMLLGTINRKLALNTSLWFEKSVYNPKMEYLHLRHYDIFWREQVMWNFSKIRVQKKPELWTVVWERMTIITERRHSAPQLYIRMSNPHEVKAAYRQLVDDIAGKTSSFALRNYFKYNYKWSSISILS